MSGRQDLLDLPFQLSLKVGSTPALSELARLEDIFAEALQPPIVALRLLNPHQGTDRADFSCVHDLLGHAHILPDARWRLELGRLL